MINSRYVKASSTSGRLNEQMVSAWLVGKISEWSKCNIEEVDISEPFAIYGLSSIAAVTLAGELEDWLGIEISPTVAYEYPTIKTLAGFLIQVFENQRRHDSEQTTE